MIVFASYYVLFAAYVLLAAMSGSVQTVLIESGGMTLFVAAAVAGFKSSAWIVVVALAGHGVFDAVHGHIIENAGMPAWWPVPGHHSSSNMTRRSAFGGTYRVVTLMKPGRGPQGGV